MLEFFRRDPIYRDRFTDVWRWPDWAATQPSVSRADTGIDLVARKADGDGYCAIQCKCYDAGTRITKTDIDSFISASNRPSFTARLIVDTGDEWGRNARSAIEGLVPECGLLQSRTLAMSAIDWPDLTRQAPDALRTRTRNTPRPHQKQAISDVIQGLDGQSRGKLIMACGTGKTYTALRIAEELCRTGGRVLYLVPSISLLQQSMREWAEQRSVPHTYIGICSDTRAGRDSEDATRQELEIPVTTDAAKIAEALRPQRGGSSTASDPMTVVFCTYQSLPLVEAAQTAGAPDFDLILCDEAHRTTGIEQSGSAKKTSGDAKKTSPFVLVHDGARIRAARRLYMTATPRLYTAGAKSKAAAEQIGVYSMDDAKTYGPELHRLPFSRAVEQGLLADYKVVVLAVSEDTVAAPLQQHLAASGSEIDLTDAARIIGCWHALRDPEHAAPGDATPARPLRRVIAFTDTIKTSKRLAQHWGAVVEQALDQADSMSEQKRARAFRCDVRHVDGQHHAMDRKARLDWLAGHDGTADGDGPPTCRILSNARCLSEGIDVPALDGVLFVTPKKSHVDIVQAVGRAMRTAPGKEYGYIVLPVAIPAGMNASDALDRNDRFGAVWSVLQALRSHDERFDAEINQIDLNRTPTARVIFKHAGAERADDASQSPDEATLPFPPLEFEPGALYAHIVDNCGDRKYWARWAEDVADIFGRLRLRIDTLLDHPTHDSLRARFDAFHADLKASINDTITRDAAGDMLAQHILTRPVFEALFEGYDFTHRNPVAAALQTLTDDFGEFGLGNETRDIEPFYESVRRRAKGLDNAEARQRVLMELYEKFFAKAMRKDAERLGIVYTPTEVVDFILRSADHILREEFGRGLTDAGVHVIDPFTGTGIFLVRLLQAQSGLIGDVELERKYREELHANEIVLLAYYIAAMHIEEAFHGRRGGEYEPFTGIVLTDTFNLHADRGGFPRDYLPVNSTRAERQQGLPIQVIVGNPPWSAGQRSSADDNPNVAYPTLEARVKTTYAARSTATLKNSLYDSYKMAIRWASDRIDEQGVIALVTNGSWIDGNVDSGIRACLAEEFTSIDILNLRGNQRTQGERSRREGGKVFGKGSRAPVAITILVRNPNARHKGCRIRYRDIGDYLTRDDKLRMLRENESIAGWDAFERVDDAVETPLLRNTARRLPPAGPGVWKEINPDEHHDWIDQRDPAFERLYPVGSKTAKSGASDDAIFQLYSNGYKTGRDAYTYNFSRDACAKNADRMATDYRAALITLRDRDHGGWDVERITRRHSSNVRWDRELKNNLRRGKDVQYSWKRIWKVHYRPFVKQNCYVDYVLVNSKYQMDRIFPAAITDNRAICATGNGSATPFSVLMVDTMPDLGLISACQCFPRYRFVNWAEREGTLAAIEPEANRIDNISDTSLEEFQAHYGDDAIDKDAIFDYVYGVLHAQAFRDRFASNLAKELPRIPFANDFSAFADAGRRLAELHLNHETGPKYPLDTIVTGGGPPKPEHCTLGTRGMRFETKRGGSTLIVNDQLRLAGIPATAHRYQVNGRSPLEWFIDRYRITKDKHSGIVNDPNGWFADDPLGLIAAIRRIVYLSVETVRIVEGLPDPTDTRN